MGTRIEIEPGYEAALAAAGLRTFDDFLNAKAGAPASKHRHRETVPIEIPVDGVMRKFFLKRVFRVPPSHVTVPLIKFRLPLSQPAHEWNICGAMKAAGLPAMQRVAVGERRVIGLPVQAFLLVEASSIQHTVQDWIVPGFPRPRVLSTSEYESLLSELGKLARQLAEAGYDWPDLDAKHIFAEPQTSGGTPHWRFFLIDLERVRKKAPSKYDTERAKSAGRISRNLSQLLSSLSPLPPQDVVKKTLLSSAGLHCDESRLVWELGYESWPWARARLPHGFVHPRRVHFTNLGDVQVDDRFIDMLRNAKLDTMNAVFSFGAGQSLSKPGLAGHRERVRLSLTDADGKPRTVYLKRYSHPPWREQLRRIAESGFKRSSARREARFTRILAGLGIPTMTTIAYGQEMTTGIERRSFLLTDEVPGTSLEKLARDKCMQLTPVEKFDVIRQLALLVNRMHIHSIFHRDLYLSHVFLSRNANGEIVLHLIDLGRMISNPLCSRRWQVKDLAALDYSSPKDVVTRADRARFMYHYRHFGSGENKRPEPVFINNLKSLFRAVGRRNKRMAAHDERRSDRLRK